MPRSDTCFICEKVKRMNSVGPGGLVAFEDEYPLTKFHMLITPKRHVQSFFDLSPILLEDVLKFTRRISIKLKTLDPTITGFNIGINDGTSAGQTIMHAHLHLIPRRDGDVEDPRGGIRLMFGERGKYWLHDKTATAGPGVHEEVQPDGE